MPCSLLPRSSCVCPTRSRSAPAKARFSTGGAIAPPGPQNQQGIISKRGYRTRFDERPLDIERLSGDLLVCLEVAPARPLHHLGRQRWGWRGLVPRQALEVVADILLIKAGLVGS